MTNVDSQDTTIYRDNLNRVVVMVRGNNRREFTPDEWKVICMAADIDLENRVYALSRALELRSMRWDEERNQLLKRIDELEKGHG
ncbi:hypothetical protein [Klebsiella pneumoniae]|uniref:hypothetical protein n=1 Tax=Klebsiella pneumoniae TaxID=573 RepID=UPI0010912A32|nr:hypothetical protein [Klebsiella pneumoniae]VGH61879.1 Uncharacterised protein [Klebsiella pneumoniae]